MVSLGNNCRSPGGGYSFNPEAPQMFDETDEASLVSSVLIAEEEPHFKTIPIAGTIFIEILSTILLVASAFMVPYFLDTDIVFILNCLHVGYWCLLFITSGYRNYHHSRMQRYGYLEFFRRTQLLLKVPLLVPSLGNALLLVCSVIFQKYCPLLKDCPLGSEMHTYNYLQIFFGAEFLILFPCLFKYLMFVIMFNKSKAIPDVHHDEILVNYAQSHAPSNEVGFREDDYMEEVLEKQADMIRYLKQHNSNLSKKIMKLSSQLSAIESHSQRF